MKLSDCEEILSNKTLIFILHFLSSRCLEILHKIFIINVLHNLLYRLSYLSNKTAKLVFVVTKFFVQAPTVTEVFTHVEKMFFMIIRIKAVYFNLFGGFTAFDCVRSTSRFCQLCIFFKCCERRELSES